MADVEQPPLISMRPNWNTGMFEILYRQPSTGECIVAFQTKYKDSAEALYTIISEHPDVCDRLWNPEKYYKGKHHA